MVGRLELRDEQWELVALILRPRRREDNHGRPWHNTRGVLNRVLWILGSGALWAEMPAIAASSNGFERAGSLKCCACSANICM